MNGTGRALWRFAVRANATDVGLVLRCPINGCEWSPPIESFGPDELGSLLRAAFRHLEDSHSECEPA